MLLALNGPVAGEGKEEAYNKWYDEVHVPDLKAIAGVVSARRFKVMQRKPTGFQVLPRHVPLTQADAAEDPRFVEFAHVPILPARTYVRQLFPSHINLF